MNLLLVVLLPVLLTISAAAAIRAAGGAERGARIAGASIAVGFLSSWFFLLSPGWMPVGAFERIGHIVIGAALVGLLLDLLSPKRFWSALAASVVILASTWASLNDGLTPSESLSPTMAGGLVALFVIAFLFIARLDQIREQQAVSFVTMCMVALALIVQAALVGDRDIAVTALLLLMTIGAFALTQLFVPVVLGDGVILSVGAALLAIAWVLVERDPSVQIGMALIPLILFADGTAKRVPLPAARISTVLYPLVLAGIAALPLGLGALITFVMYGP